MSACSFVPDSVTITMLQFSSVAQLCPTLWPHESQHARPPCPSPAPRVHPDSRPSSQWCHPAVSSSVVPFFSCPQSLPASKSFPMSQLFASGGQTTRVSALASFLPKKSQGWDSWRQKAEKINKKWFQVSNPLSLNSVKCFTLSQQFSLPFLDCLVWKHDFQQWNAMCLLVRLLCENDLCAEFLFEKWKLYRL